MDLIRKMGGTQRKREGGAIAEREKVRLAHRIALLQRKKSQEERETLTRRDKLSQGERLRC